MTAGLNLHILVVLSADFAELEGGAHLTVQLVLLLEGGGGNAQGPNTEFVEAEVVELL